MARTTYSEEPYPTIEEACRLDDVQLLSRTLLAQGVTTTNHSETNLSLLRYACIQCFRFKALTTLAYILSDCGFSTDKISSIDVSHTPDLSTRVIDVLLAYGWNINKRDLRFDPTSKPFLWHVLRNEDLVK